jgi:hypothetical protein
VPRNLAAAMKALFGKVGLKRTEKMKEFRGIATRNVAHFADMDLKVVDPWAS